MCCRDVDGKFHKKLLPMREVVTNMCQLAGGLALVHLKGVVHSDLHLGNILQGQGGKGWILSDFGNSSHKHKPNGELNELHVMM